MASIDLTRNLKNVDNEKPKKRYFGHDARNDCLNFVNYYETEMIDRHIFNVKAL